MNSKLLVNAEASGAYAPQPGGRRGFLLFVYGGDLLAQPFDPQRFELSGERSVLARNLLYNIGHADFSVSASGVLAYRAGSRANRQLAWFDREGRVVAAIGSPNDYYAWSLSPDEKRIAAMESDPSGAGSSIWITELASGAAYRLTEGSDFVGTPVWSPDGSDVLFSVGGEQAMSLERQPLNGRASVGVLKSEGPKFVSDWSSDGRFITYFTPWPEWKRVNIFVAEIGGPRQEKPRRAWPNEYSEDSAYFSPAASRAGPRWIAYVSDETGRDEVYVRNFPAGDRKWLVSTGGGWQSHWRRDGRELFYLTLDGILMAVPLRDARTFQPGSPHPLFRTAIPPWEGPPEIPTSAYAVSKDGQRFLINGTIEGLTPLPITIATHWQTGLR